MRLCIFSCKVVRQFEIVQIDNKLIKESELSNLSNFVLKVIILI